MKIIILLGFLFSLSCFSKDNITFFRVKEKNELNALSYKSGIIFKDINVETFSVKKDGIEVLSTDKTPFKKIKIKNGNKFVFDSKTFLVKGNYELNYASSKKVYFSVNEFKDINPPLIELKQNVKNSTWYFKYDDLWTNQLTYAWIADWESGEEFWSDYSYDKKFSYFTPIKPLQKDSRFSNLPESRELYLAVRVDTVQNDQKASIKILDQYYSYVKFLNK